MNSKYTATHMSVSLMDIYIEKASKMYLNQNDFETIIDGRGFPGFQSTLEIIILYFEHSLRRVLPLNGFS